MTKPDAPGGLPPDLPAEYAEAYRRGYQRAWGESPEPPEPEREPEPPAEREPLSSYDHLFADIAPAPWDGPTHREPPEQRERAGWLAPAILGAMVLLLILSAYGLGRMFSESVGSGSSSGGERLEMPEAADTATPDRVQGRRWDGDVTPLADVAASSSCVMPPGNDAAGRSVSYAAARSVDGDFSTAWRCPGDGRGVTVRFELASRVRLAEVGLVPGYAKTDPQSKADRYAENNRITRVRWVFPDGRSIVQKLDGSPTRRGLQTMRIPPTRTDSVTLELLASVDGPRNTVAISEVHLAGAVG